MVFDVYFKFLEKIFDPLLKFIRTWFDERQDRDGDGLPEWTSAIQSGFDENPSFSPWLDWSQGADISLVESPDLCSFLSRELALLGEIAYKQPLLLKQRLELSKLAFLLGQPVARKFDFRILFAIVKLIEDRWNADADTQQLDVSIILLVEDNDINREVAEYWRENYDLRHILDRDWATLGPKLEGKIHIYCGDMDNYYLNNAVYLMEDFLEATTDPYYGGEIDYGDRAEHCWNGDHENPNHISRLRYNTMYLPKILDRIGKSAPEGADLSSWRY